MKNISAVSDNKDIVTVEYVDNVTAAADKSDSFTINNTVNYPLLALTAYGKSTQGYATSGGEPLRKNIFDFTTWKNTVGIKGGTVNYTDNSIQLNATEADCFTSGQSGSNYTAPTYQFKTKPNTQYTLSWSSDNDNKGYVYVFIDGKVSNSKSQNNSTAKHLTFVTSASSSYVLIRFGVQNSGESIAYSNIQLEKGNTATEYEPYYSNPNPECPVPIESIGDSGSLTVTSQDGTAINIADVGIEGYGIPVSSGGNYTDKNGQQWVCDELIVNADGTGKIVKNISKSKLSSANNWLASSATTSVDRYYASLPVLPDCNANVKPYCTHFNRNVSGNIVNGISINNTSIGFAYATYGTTTVDDFKKFLDVNDVYVIYALITPTETELTSEQLTALQTLIDKYGAFTAYFMSTQDGTPTPENPVEIVSTTDLYRTKTATIATGLPLRGIPVSNGGNYTDANGQEWICDTVEYNYTEAVKIQRIAVIDSYNGETVGDTYISTTGGLNVGSAVIYPAETVTETQLTADELNQLRGVVTFDNITNVYNNEGADMSVEYLTSKAVSKAVMPIITALRGDNNA